MAKIKSRSPDIHKTKPKNVHKHAFERVYWPYIPVVLAISLLLGLGASSGNLQAYMHHPGGRVLSYSTSMSISGLLSGTNTQRASNGVASLTLNEKLDAAAQAKADDMAARNYWSHYTPDGNPPWVFVNAQNYSYQKLGENLATGYSDEQSTINGWMASAPHRENLLDPSFKEVGFGFANNPNYTAAGGGPMTIVVAFYGQPKVLAAATPAPTKSAPIIQTPTKATPAPTPTPQPAAEPAVPTASPQEIPKKQPATTQTPKTATAPAVKQSRVQLALTSRSIPPAATNLTIIVALFLGVFWLSRHLRALHRFLLKGEQYIVRHPLTDIGLLVIACLLFILSQTAGFIQ
jgi:hypothetical protein